MAQKIRIEITEEKFRATGYTINALKYPLSDVGVASLCRFNGITPAQAPQTWRYAPNEYMRRWRENQGRLEQMALNPGKGTPGL